MSLCPSCGSGNTSPYYNIEKLPLLLFPVKEDVRFDIVQDKIDSIYCKDCNHIFAMPLSEEYSSLIYDKYYAYYPYDSLETMDTHYRKPFELFFENVIDENQSIFSDERNLLEIGCSSGVQLEFFEKFNFNCWGIDPSPLNESTDSNIMSGYYQDYDLNEKYDIIVSRFVLEHIGLLDDFLLKAKKDIRKNGLLFLQVPNVLEFINNFIPSFLAHEHTQYFNIQSIVKLVERNGFKVVSTLSDNSQSICIAVSVSDGSNNKVVGVNQDAKLFSKFLEKRKIIGKDLINLLKGENRNVCFYGAGLMLSWVLYDLNYLDVNSKGTVIDDNEQISGLFMPQSDYEIKAFSEELINDFSLIVLTLNPVYHDTVFDRLSKSNFQGEVYSLSNNGLNKIN